MQVIDFLWYTLLGNDVMEADEPDGLTNSKPH